MKTDRRGWRGIASMGVILLVVGSLLAACGSSEEEGSKTTSPKNDETNNEQPDVEECESFDKVNYILAAATVTLGSVGYVQVPDAMGYFAEECLEVNIQASGQTNSEVALAQLETGRFDVAVPATLSAVTFAAKNPTIKVVYFTAFKNVGIYVPVDGDVKTPGDLKGKKLGVSAIGTGTAAYCLEAARLEGVEENQLEQIPINSGLTAVAESLRSDRIDAWCGIDSDLVAFNNAGLESKRLDSDFDKDLLPPGSIVATDSFINDHPDVMERFLRAIMKGYIFAVTEPEKATAIALRDYPESIPAADTKEGSFESALAIVNERMKNSPPPGYPDTPFGYMADSAIEAGVVPLVRGGLVPEGLDLNDWRNLSFIEPAWKSIDRSAIEDEARSAEMAKW